MRRLLLAAAPLFILGSGASYAACTVTNPGPFSTATSLSTQNSAAVSFTGGCMDGVPIGQNTPAAGKFTTLSYNTTSGLAVTPLRLLDFKNNDGTTLAAAAAAGKFGLTSTPGTVEQLLTEAANSNTKTDIAQAEFVLPPSYTAGQNITVTANCDYTLGAGTVGTHTLAAAAYLTANDGTQGTTLIATAAQTVPAAAGDVTFTITGTTLAPGSRLMLTFTLVIEDSGGSNITAHVNSVRIS